MTTAPFATARLEGHEVVLTIGEEQIRYDNSLNGYQSAHAIVEQVNALQAREQQEPDIEEAHRQAILSNALREDDDDPPTKVEGQRRSTSEPPEGHAA